MSEWFESLKGLVNERVGNPIILAYAFAWLFINYHIVLMVFSDATVMEKITFIPAEYADWQDKMYFLGSPLVIALLYSVGAPWLKHLVLWYEFWQGRFTRALKIKHENATLITAAERDELVRRHQQQLDRLHEEMSVRATYYSDLALEKDSLVKKVSELNIKISELESKNSLMETAQGSLESQLKLASGKLELVSEELLAQQNARKDLKAAIPALRNYVGDNENVGASNFWEHTARIDKAQILLDSLEREFEDDD